LTLPRLYYCDHHQLPLPPRHKFPTAKYKLLREALARDGLFDFEPAPFADPGTIGLVHSPEYVSRFIAGTLDEAVVRRIGFPWSEGLVRRTLASVGGTIAAARDALCRGWCGSLAGGTHHAFREQGAGFCVFNDIAVAIATLRYEKLIRTAAVIDLDVHQGDGTARIFEDDPTVLTVSMHGHNNYPFRKQTSRIDVALPDGADDALFLHCLDRVLPDVLAFQPDIVFYQAGVDSLAEDKLGVLSLTQRGLKRRDARVLGICAARGLPCAIALGGGYADPVQPSVEAHANTFRIAARLFNHSK
jgi:acetoin utilization deacetylase AcuC-like enzyme